jgi:hypothetical protein
MFGNRGCKSALARGFGKLNMAASLTDFSESSCFEFAFDLAIRSRPHAALTSISKERTCGASVATGGVK